VLHVSAAGLVAQVQFYTKMRLLDDVLQVEVPVDKHVPRAKAFHFPTVAKTLSVTNPHVSEYD
jgi:hypothetical protein